MVAGRQTVDNLVVAQVNGGFTCIHYNLKKIRCRKYIILKFVYAHIRLKVFILPFIRRS